MKFTPYNANPKGWKTDDCVIRAIAYATQKTWNEVFDILCAIGSKKCRMPNDDIVWQKYLENIGWVKHHQPKWPDGTKYTVKEFADRFAPTMAIVRVANHLTVIEGRCLMDTWDCSYKTVGNYWTKGE